MASLKFGLDLRWWRLPSAQGHCICPRLTPDWPLSFPKDWKTEFDELGRVKKTIRPSGNYEEYGFDALGNRTTFWNAEFKPITFGVDAQGRVTSITNAIDKVTEFSFDDAGNLFSRKDAKNAETLYEYDSLNRLVSITNESVEVATFDYDPNGNVISHRGTENTEVFFGYDEMNRLTASTQTESGVTSEVAVDTTSMVIEPTSSIPAA